MLCANSAKVIKEMPVRFALCFYPPSAFPLARCAADTCFRSSRKKSLPLAMVLAADVSNDSVYLRLWEPTF